MARRINSGINNMAVFPREIIGLYLEKDRLQYCCAKKGLLGLSLKSPSPDMEPQGSIEGSDYSCLRKFLEAISPGTRYEIFVALPRGAFFVRDMALPPMGLEDAWISVQNNLSVNCHLPLEEVYYDISLSQKGNGNISALIFYASRKEVDRILDIFSDTGKRHLLKRLMPFSLGVYLWLLMQGYPLPLKLITPPQEGSYELGVYSKEGLLYSASWPESEGYDASRFVLAGLEARFEDMNGQVYFLGQEGTPGLPPPPDNKLKPLPLIMENPGVAAIAGALSRRRQVSLDGRVTKVKQFRPWHVLLPLAVIVLFALGFLTWHGYRDLLTVSAQVKTAETEVQALRNKIVPLDNRLKALESSRKLYKDIEDYVKGRPDLYKIINETARLVPEGTRFSYLLYERGKVTIRGTSRDALEVLNLLRKSKMFTQVKLVGSVSRDRFYNERFSISIKLKQGPSQSK